MITIEQLINILETGKISFASISTDNKYIEIISNERFLISYCIVNERRSHQISGIEISVSTRNFRNDWWNSIYRVKLSSESRYFKRALELYKRRSKDWVNTQLNTLLNYENGNQ